MVASVVLALSVWEPWEAAAQGAVQDSCSFGVCATLFKANELGMEFSLATQMVELGAQIPVGAFDRAQQLLDDLGGGLDIGEVLASRGPLEFRLDPEASVIDRLGDRGPEVVASFQVGEKLGYTLIQTTKISQNSPSASPESTVVRDWSEDAIVISGLSGQMGSERTVRADLGTSSEIQAEVCRFKADISSDWQRGGFRCANFIDRIRAGLVSIRSQPKPEEVSGRKLNGEQCNSDDECLAKTCYPKPVSGEMGLCMPPQYNCAWPADVPPYVPGMYGERREWVGQIVTCVAPAEGRARFASGR